MYIKKKKLNGQEGEKTSASVTRKSFLFALWLTSGMYPYQFTKKYAQWFLITGPIRTEISQGAKQNSKEPKWTLSRAGKRANHKIDKVKQLIFVKGRSYL